jgi:arginyl-tRNA synthetase
MHRPTTTLREQAEACLQEAFEALGFPGQQGLVRDSDREDLADLQCNHAMVLAKAARQAPRGLAHAVANALAGQTLFDSVSVAGAGFINLRFADAALTAQAQRLLGDGSLGVARRNGGLVMIDFGGPNIAKPLHVGHLRSLVIGESLRRLYRAVGCKTLSDIHLGDWGLQLGMLIAELGRHLPRLGELLADAASAPADAEDFAGWFGAEDLQRLYTRASQACQQDEARMNEARALTARLQAGEPGLQRLWQAVRQVSLASQLADIEQLGVRFDLLLGESDVQYLIPPMLAELERRGLARRSEGALVMDVGTTEDGAAMPPLLLAKSDGAALYATTDLATILDRVQRFQPAEIVYVVDQRQALHFRQVFRAAELAGLSAGTRLVHVGFGTVNGPDGRAFKTREGGVARLSDLLDTAVRGARARLLASDAVGDIDAAALQRLATQVGIGALKVADLGTHRLTGYVFDADRMLAFEGRTGPYIQYACTRIRQLLAKVRPPAPSTDDGQIQISHDSERALLLACSRFPDAVNGALASLAPNVLADHLFQLAQRFSRFYASCPVAGAATPTLVRSRIQLCALTQRMLERGLDLLGVEVPERM